MSKVWGYFYMVEEIVYLQQEPEFDLINKTWNDDFSFPHYHVLGEIGLVRNMRKKAGDVSYATAYIKSIYKLTLVEEMSI